MVMLDDVSVWLIQDLLLIINYDGRFFNAVPNRIYTDHKYFITFLPGTPLSSVYIG